MSFGRISRWALALCCLSGLAACGGGAGERLLQPMAQQQERPTFNVQAAFNNAVTDTTTLAFKVEGNANGVPYQGQGSYEQGMLQTVSEWDSQGGALRKLTPVRMTLTIDGRDVKVETAAMEFYSRGDLRLLGRKGPAPAMEFTEVTRYDGLPQEAQVGDYGTLYTARRYTDEARRTPTGTTTATYTVEPDGAALDTALLVLRVADSRADGVDGSTTTTVYRISRAGTARRVSETTADATTRSELRAVFM